ncbi:hypothetical protein CYMTET_41547 [Cymbomonas tetramitiformis]|uniref:Uncharacterized protein n=1 Tax=Cymbomonas tetramitiformis TaxID=36881 RepID=A0AAE0C6X7_9CHLO|nr:hypothetical protein CYMTET_41547 [Cymbomonas tetramitiformis]
MGRGGWSPLKGSSAATEFETNAAKLESWTELDSKLKELDKKTSRISALERRQLAKISHASQPYQHLPRPLSARASYSDSKHEDAQYYTFRKLGRAEDEMRNAGRSKKDHEKDWQDKRGPMLPKLSSKRTALLERENRFQHIKQPWQDEMQRRSLQLAHTRDSRVPEQDVPLENTSSFASPSRARLARQEWLEDYAPGPGYYDPSRPISPEKYGKSSSFLAVPRDPRQAPPSPGPGHYNVDEPHIAKVPRREFVRVSYANTAEARLRQGPSSPAKRTAGDASEESSPGPGYYSPERPISPQKHGPTSSFLAVDREKRSRHRSPSKTDGPGPGYYSPERALSPERQSLRSSFLATDRDTAMLVHKPESCAPGPGHYHPESVTEPDANGHLSSFLAVNRDTASKQRSPAPISPGPAYYNPHELQSEGTTVMYSFNTVERDVAIKQRAPESIAPGPGYYKEHDLGPVERDGNKSAFLAVERDVAIKQRAPESIAPGPGYYKEHDLGPVERDGNKSAFLAVERDVAIKQRAPESIAPGPGYYKEHDLGPVERDGNKSAFLAVDRDTAIKLRAPESIAPGPGYYREHDLGPAERDESIAPGPGYYQEHDLGPAERDGNKSSFLAVDRDTAIKLRAPESIAPGPGYYQEHDLGPAERDGNKSAFLAVDRDTAIKLREPESIAPGPGYYQEHDLGPAERDGNKSAFPGRGP